MITQIMYLRTSWPQKCKDTVSGFDDSLALIQVERGRNTIVCWSWIRTNQWLDWFIKCIIYQTKLMLISRVPCCLIAQFFSFVSLRASRLLQEAEGCVGREGQTINAGVYIHWNSQDHGELVQRWPADLCFLQIQHHHDWKLLHPGVSQHRRQGGCWEILLWSVQRCRKGHVWSSCVHSRLVQLFSAVNHWMDSVFVWRRDLKTIVCLCVYFMSPGSLWDQ